VERFYEEEEKEADILDVKRGGARRRRGQAVSTGNEGIPKVIYARYLRHANPLATIRAEEAAARRALSFLESELTAPVGFTRLTSILSLGHLSAHDKL
jgi:hypothetical protein